MKNIDFTDFFNVFLSGATIGLLLILYEFYLFVNLNINAFTNDFN